MRNDPLLPNDLPAPPSQQRRYFSAVSSPVATAAEAPRQANRTYPLHMNGSPVIRPLSIIRTNSPERSLSFSAPTSPFMPRFPGARMAGAQGSAQPRRARTNVDGELGFGSHGFGNTGFRNTGFGSHEAALPLLPAALAQNSGYGASMSQQVSPTHQRTHSGFGGSYSAACSPREPPRRSSIAVEGVGGMRPAASDDDDDDESEEERINSAESSCDGDIDADSMALDDTTNDAGSTRGVRLAGLRRQSVGSAPRNKAVVRLMSLVEEDRKPLASEMEHEGHITRSIRHSSVQEWLRSSSSSSSASVVLASPPLDDSARVAKPGMRMAAARAARDGEAGILFPASPASSAMSSPKLLAAGPSSCPNTAGIVPAAVRLGKRKSLDDGDDDDSAGEPQAGPSSTVLARGPAYKRVAMSPSGLRAQVTFAKAGARRVLAHVAPRSGPSSPLLTSRPTLAGSLAATAGTCPPLGATRTRSRSGASLLTGPTGLNMVQTNGVFSRMNINDGDDDTDR